MSEARRPTFHLVESAKGGDRDALNVLFERYGPILRAEAKKKMSQELRAAEDPEDIAEEAVLEAVVHFDGFAHKRERTFRSWILTIVRNKVLDLLKRVRSKKRDPKRVVRLERKTTRRGTRTMDVPADCESVSEAVARRDAFDRVRSALDTMPVRYRRAIELIHLEGQSLRSAAECLGLRSADAARMLVKRAEKELQRLLKSLPRPG
jgi:RNA polymerase sigma-70 factor (ECF subfamily)